MLGIRYVKRFLLARSHLPRARRGSVRSAPEAVNQGQSGREESTGAMSNRGWMRGRTRAIWAIGPALVLGLLGSPAEACDLLRGCQQPASGASSERPAYGPEWLMSQINQERATRGLGALRSDPDLARMARRHATRMAERAKVFHNTSGLRAWHRRTGDTVGENVASGFDLPAAHDSIMASPSHRATLLGNFKRMGVGIARVEGEVFVVEVFARSGRKPSQGSSHKVAALTKSRGDSADEGRSDPSGSPVLVRTEPPLHQAAAPVPTEGDPTDTGPLALTLAAALGLGALERSRRARLHRGR